MRQPLFEHRLELAGYETRALELEGEGPPLVLLHGYGDSADTWRLVLERLGRAGRAALAVDLPGFADADDLEHGEMLPQYDASPPRRSSTPRRERRRAVVVAGNSLGGCVALRPPSATTCRSRASSRRARGPRHGRAGSS